MTPEQQEIIDRLTDRLSNIQWGHVPDGVERWYSSRALLVEYLRRMKLCGIQLAEHEPWLYELDEQIKAEIEQRITELIPNWIGSDHIPNGIGSYHKGVMPYVFVWNLLSMHWNQECLNPFEPVLRFYERGAYGFWHWTGIADFFVGKDRFGLFLGEIKKAKPLLDLSDEALDKIDATKS